MEKYNKSMRGLVETLHEASLNENYLGRYLENTYNKFEDLLRKYKIYATAEVDRDGNPTTLYLINPKNKKIGLKIGIALEGFFFVYDNNTEVYLGDNKWVDMKKYPFELSDMFYGGEELNAFTETNAKILKDILTK